ncbi:MAG: hypothetical protein KAJ14_11810 [Candidatus Omnitrophica bacterium]|nr:hypothetical protein [Candidatus Omnitrophota bacterium]
MMLKITAVKKFKYLIILLFLFVSINAFAVEDLRNNKLDKHSKAILKDISIDVNITIFLKNKNAGALTALIELFKQYRAENSRIKYSLMGTEVRCKFCLFSPKKLPPIFKFI